MPLCVASVRIAAISGVFPTPRGPSKISTDPLPERAQPKAPAASFQGVPRSIRAMRARETSSEDGGSDHRFVAAGRAT